MNPIRTCKKRKFTLSLLLGLFYMWMVYTDVENYNVCHTLIVNEPIHKIPSVIQTKFRKNILFAILILISTIFFEIFTSSIFCAKLNQLKTKNQ